LTGLFQKDEELFEIVLDVLIKTLRRICQRALMHLQVRQGAFFCLFGTIIFNFIMFSLYPSNESVGLNLLIYRIDS
jgi:hypothetical protein